MPFSPEVEATRAQVFQQVGRNVLRFQRLELLLKSMVAGSRLNVTEGDSSTAHESRVQAIHKKTLGSISGQFFEEVISNQPPHDGLPAFLSDTTIPEDRFHMATAITLHFSPEEHASWQLRLKALITERNQLVHSSLFQMELETLEGCHRTLAALEKQGARVSAEIDFLKPILKGLEASKATLRALLNDDAFWTDLSCPET